MSLDLFNEPLIAGLEYCEDFISAAEEAGSAAREQAEPSTPTTIRCLPSRLTSTTRQSSAFPLSCKSCAGHGPTIREHEVSGAGTDGWY